MIYVLCAIAGAAVGLGADLAIRRIAHWWYDRRDRLRGDAGICPRCGGQRRYIGAAGCSLRGCPTCALKAYMQSGGGA